MGNIVQTGGRHTDKKESEGRGYKEIYRRREEYDKKNRADGEKERVLKEMLSRVGDVK